MNTLIYYIFIFPISILPYFLLYSVSNGIYFILYYLIGYRKEVIRKNVYDSFPEKTTVELDKIIKKFYKHFADLLIEGFKNFTISEKQIKKRVVFNNIEVLNELYDKNRSVVTMTSHYGNWEMLAVAIGDISKHKQLAIYKPIKNRFFDRKMKRVREKLGLKMFPMSDTIKYFKKKYETPVSIFFASDQWPSNPKRAFWTKFLQRDTPVLFGAEQYATLFDWSLVYCEMIKVKRGHYVVNFKLIAENPTELERGTITNSYIQELEKTISIDPAYWLWSHKRWKRTKEEVFETNNA